MSFACDASSLCVHEVMVLTFPSQPQHRLLLFWEGCPEAPTYPPAQEKPWAHWPWTSAADVPISDLASPQDAEVLWGP